MIVMKDGDGPSVVGLICNALIMGLVDRSYVPASKEMSVYRLLELAVPKFMQVFAS